jgi:hypothetical protein
MLLDYKTLHFDVDPFHYFLVRVLVCSDVPPLIFVSSPSSSTWLVLWCAREEKVQCYEGKVH